MRKIIKYKKSRLRFNLLIGLFWFLLGFTGIFIKSRSYWPDYGFIFISILYLSTYFYYKKNHYLIITDNKIVLNKLIKKRIDINNIKKIKRFSGEYTLISNDTELKINTELIENDFLLDLNEYLEKIEIKND